MSRKPPAPPPEITPTLEQELARLEAKIADFKARRAPLFAERLALEQSGGVSADVDSQAAKATARALAELGRAQSGPTAADRLAEVCLEIAGIDQATAILDREAQVIAGKIVNDRRDAAMPEWRELVRKRLMMCLAIQKQNREMLEFIKSKKFRGIRPSFPCSEHLEDTRAFGTGFVEDIVYQLARSAVQQGFANRSEIIAAEGRV